MLYECLAGRAPFKASNYIELSNVIKNTCHTLPMPPGISDELADLLRYLSRQGFQLHECAHNPSLTSPRRLLLCSVHWHEYCFLYVYSTLLRQCLGRRVLKRDPEERIAVDDFFFHPWLYLDSYQRTIVIGPDDEPEGATR